MIDVGLHLPIHLTVLVVDDLRVDGGSGAHEAMRECARRYHASGAASCGAVPGIEHARALFRALGIDPTRRRPCSEALLNRALKGQDMPHVNQLVDVGNWCALDFLLPLGVYDRARIHGSVVLRRGGPAEAYEAIGDKEMHLEGRYLLADADGPFGSPITDSRRTAVTLATTSAAVFMYAPAAYDIDLLRDQNDLMAARIIEHCGGRVVQGEVVSRPPSEITVEDGS